MRSAHDLLDLSGRTVIVAGAGGGGIGTAVSGFLAGAGALVIGVDNRAEALADFSAATEAASGRAHPAVVADLREPEEVERLVIDAGDSLYGLVHVAGGMWPPQWAALMDMDPAVFDDVMDLNLRTTLLSTTAVARRLKALGRGGSIVALSSVAGLTAMPFGAPYAAAKSALMSLVRTAALEWGPLGIRINAVAPGTIRTPKSLRNNPNPPPTPQPKPPPYRSAGGAAVTTSPGPCSSCCQIWPAGSPVRCSRLMAVRRPGPRSWARTTCRSSSATTLCASGSAGSARDASGCCRRRSGWTCVRRGCRAAQLLAAPSLCYRPRPGLSSPLNSQLDRCELVVWAPAPGAAAIPSRLLDHDEAAMGRRGRSAAAAGRCLFPGGGRIACLGRGPASRSIPHHRHERIAGLTAWSTASEGVRSLVKVAAREFGKQGHHRERGRAAGRRPWLGLASR